MGLNDTLTRSLVTDGDLTTFTLGGRYGTLETRVMSNCFPIAVLVIQGTRAYENVNDHPDALYYCRFCPRGHCWTSSLSLLRGREARSSGGLRGAGDGVHRPMSSVGNRPA